MSVDTHEVTLYDYREMLAGKEDMATIIEDCGNEAEMEKVFTQLHRQIAFSDDVAGLQRNPNTADVRTYRYFWIHNRGRVIYLLEFRKL